MSELRDKHISSYVEDRVLKALRKYAADRGVTISAAIRYLIIQGIRLEARRKRADAAIVAEFISGKAG